MSASKSMLSPEGAYKGINSADSGLFHVMSVCQGYLGLSVLRFFSGMKSAGSSDYGLSSVHDSLCSMDFVLSLMQASVSFS